MKTHGVLLFGCAQKGIRRIAVSGRKCHAYCKFRLQVSGISKEQNVTHIAVCKP